MDAELAGPSSAPTPSRDAETVSAATLPGDDEKVTFHQHSCAATVAE